MFQKTVFSFLFLMLINLFAVQAQTSDYKKEWKKIDSLENKGLIHSARQATLQVFAKAGKEKNAPQQIKAAMYVVKYRNMTEEESGVNNYFYLDTLIAQTNAPARNILQSLQAEFLLEYKNNNRWQFYDRTALEEEKSADISTWSVEKLVTTISEKYRISLENKTSLQQTGLSEYEVIINKGENAEGLRPTIYDLLAHRALDFFESTENDVTKPAYNFIINDEKYFAPVNEFVNLKITTKDTASLYLHALHIYQDLFRFHLADKNRAALADADLRRLAFVHEHGVFTNVDSLYTDALQKLEQEFAGTEQGAEAAYLRARMLLESINDYEKPDSSRRYNMAKAKILAEAIIQKYPSVQAALKAKNLIAEITAPSMSLAAEEVNTINTPFRLLIKYKNVGKIYLKVIKTDRNFVKQNTNDWKSLLNKPALKTWEQNLPGVNDYLEHSTEIKIDGLASGVYYIIASYQPGFSENDNLMSFQLTYVSDISEIIHNNKDLFILDRNTGQPLVNASVQLWQEKYDYSSGKYTSVKNEKYTTDKNGYVKLNSSKSEYNFSFQVNYKNDELFLLNNYSLYNYNYENDRQRNQIFLFTDRSIYRPGQKIFFKGIMVSSNTSGRKNEVVKDKTTTVILYDANGQKQGRLQLTTNAYGSYNGSFDLPEGMLNGQFMIADSVTNSSQYFSVEEYKRPKFSVEIKQPEGSYRVNDSITVKGNAKAFAGNNINAAKVKYRVVRKVQYPWWWGWRMPGRNTEQMEITNGEVETDESGEFTIVFKAIPDEAAAKKNQPTFTYEISADVTDINGETHSGITNVVVKYQALNVNIVSAGTLDADSLQKIKITSTNTNGVFEKSMGTLQIEKLQSNSKIYRSRYWEKPDQFMMSREEFEKYFPYDEYNEESNVQTWAVEKIFPSLKFFTSSDGAWNAGINLPEGWYKFTVTSKDKYGEEVKDIKYIQLTRKKMELTVPFITTENKNIYEPGDEVKYIYKTGFKNIWLIEEIKRTEGDSKFSFLSVSENEPYSNALAVKEADRGGILRSQAFVQHNRFYNYNQLSNVPWTDKILKIDYTSFRDNILPGSAEKWSIKISGDKKDAVAAEALISMYDASLDQLKPHSWQNLQELWPRLNVNGNWTSNSFQKLEAIVANALTPKYSNIKPVVYPNIINDGLHFYYGRMGREVAYSTAMPTAAAISDSAVTVQNALIGKVSGMRVQDESKDASVTPVKIEQPGIQIRKNFNETAFFFPDLKTDAAGNISFSFTIPEALTKWKMQTLAHTQDLASAYSERTLITQKPLMVQPNAPRFLREGDALEFSSKIVNLTDKEITGTSVLQLFDAATDKPVDGLFNNIFQNQYFTAPAGQSIVVKFPIAIPTNFNSVLSYRITAQSSTKDSSGNTFSDGEQAALPVLSNRMLVTESLPLNVRNTNSKSFTFDKLLDSEKNSTTLTNESLTIEYTSNPAWYAVQALPYLMEYPYECAEQNFNRYYANALAAYVAGSTPKLKAVFEKWAAGGKDAAALMSNLQKNEELKSALLEETPWVLQAKNETEQKKNIGILFNLVRLAKEKDATYNKLKEAQTPNGGFSWFKGGRDDRYITQYIITGIGHLRKLNALSADDYNRLKTIVSNALPYLDARLNEEYQDLIKYKAKLGDNNLSQMAIQYLYMRSFFPETDISGTANTAYKYYYGQAQKYWLQNNKYTQGMIALALHRTGDDKTAKAIIASLKETAIDKEETGMYWKEFTTGGYYWYQAPIESQSMLIEAFTDIDKNETTINDLKTWLLKQKQTQNWGTTKATAEACYALLLNGNNWLNEEKNVTITLGKNTVISSTQSAEAGTGYFKKRIEGTKVEPEMGNIKVTITNQATAPPAPQGGSNPQLEKQTNKKVVGTKVVGEPPLGRQGGSWGAVYWQYFEDLDKITFAATPLKLVKKLYIEKNSDRGPLLTELKDGAELKVGDKLKVRIELRSDRDMEYVHMKDMRASATEPVNVISSYKYQDGLGYYESTKDASTNFFFSWLPKGTYVFEYSLFVTHAGNFSNGITTIQCMYAPEFTSHSEGVRISVKDK